jgi:hypothetical protein
MRTAFVGIILFLSSWTVYAGDTERQYTLAIAKTIHYVDQNNDMVWPNYHLSTTPTIAFFPDSKHTYAYNFLPKKLNWQPVEIEDQPIYFLADDALNLNDVNMVFRMPIEEQASFVSRMPRPDTLFPEDVLLDMVELAHERFHAYQAYESAFESDHKPYKNYDGFNQLENVKLIYLEIAAFKTYLLTNGIKSEIALQDAAAIQQYRQQFLNKDSLAYEHKKERYEGSASYVGYQSDNLNPDEYKRRATTVGYYVLDATCNISLLKTKDEINNCAWNMRYYLTGLIAGYALDQKGLSPAWKIHVERNQQSIEEILVTYFNLSGKESTQRVANAKQNLDYDYNAINVKIDAIMTPFLQEVSQAQNAYKALPGIEFRRYYSNCEVDRNVVSDKYFRLSSYLNLEKNTSGDISCDDKSVVIHYNNIPLIFNSHPNGVPYGIFPENDWQAFRGST